MRIVSFAGFLIALQIAISPALAAKIYGQGVTCTIGGSNAPVQYAGGAPGLVAGLMQVNVQIPAGIQAGSAVPVMRGSTQMLMR